MAIRELEILNNLYGLMMDINYHRDDADVLNDLKTNPEPFIEERLIVVKRMLAKQKVLANNRRMGMAMEQLRQLKTRGIEELRKLLTAEEQLEYAQLFRKFEGTSKDDEAAILEDQQLLKLLERLKNESGDGRHP